MPPDPITQDPISASRSQAPDQSAAQKRRIRREVRARRNDLTPATARAAAFRAVHRLWSLPCLARAASVALYLPAAGELDCSPFILQAWKRGRRVFLPVVTKNGLRFAPFHPHSALRANRFGILEPASPVRQWRTAHQLDVIVAPLVAFDMSGQRLGMGGGFYDRTLAFLRRRSRTRRPHFIALAFELQKISDLPCDAWDVGLDAVVTESATYRFR